MPEREVQVPVLELDALIAVLVIAGIIAAGAGYVVWRDFYAPQPGLAAKSSNWEGYVDRSSVTWAKVTIALPPPQDWRGNGTLSLWVGLGGGPNLVGADFPFWQSGLTMTLFNGSFYTSLFTEGAPNAQACGGGVCDNNWTKLLITTVPVSLVSVFISLNGVALLNVTYPNGTAIHYTPPHWDALSGLGPYHYAEWIAESPSNFGFVLTMPTLTEGVTFSGLNDSAHLADMGTYALVNNPNGQVILLSALSQGSFTARPIGG